MSARVRIIDLGKEYCVWKARIIIKVFQDFRVKSVTRNVTDRNSLLIVFQQSPLDFVTVNKSIPVVAPRLCLRRRRRFVLALIIVLQYSGPNNSTPVVHPDLCHR